MSLVTDVRLTKEEFEKFRLLIKKITGIHMRDEKISLVQSRLAKRLRNFGFRSYLQYYELIQEDAKELQVFIDTITTNETSFFREPHHFDFLKNEVFAKIGTDVRVWSAACSIGAEAYSTAMICDDALSRRNLKWEIFCSDINVDVIEQARRGLYQNKFIPQIPESYLKRYCLRGYGKYEGYFMIEESLKERLSFRRLNLMETIPDEIGEFNVIFLRNILIYFNNPERKFIVENVAKKLKKGGYLLIGHSESLFNITQCVKQVKPTIYIKN